MDVHAPHEPIHTFKDFLLHILTITIGLLIALGLEAAVENLHHRHVLHTAEQNLRTERESNRDLLRKDRQEIARSEKALNENLLLLEAIRRHQPTDANPNFTWEWSGMSSAAWNTARDTGALALMPYEHAQGYSVIYDQQKYVDDQATLYIRDIYLSGASAEGGRKLSELSPDEVDRAIVATEQAVVDLKLLDDLTRSLDAIYNNADKEL